MPPQRILIVEDEAPVARLVETCLKRLGYGVTAIVDNGEAALRAAAAEPPALALLDIELLGSMDGLEVAERLRRELGVPAVFLTGRGDEETLEDLAR